MKESTREALRDMLVVGGICVLAVAVIALGVWLLVDPHQVCVCDVPRVLVSVKPIWYKCPEGHLVCEVQP